MKDALGHGSNGGVGTALRNKLALEARVFGTRSNLLVSGGKPVSSNAHAAEELASSLKSTQAPVHSAMNNVTAVERKPGESDADYISRRLVEMRTQGSVVRGTTDGFAKAKTRFGKGEY